MRNEGSGVPNETGVNASAARCAETEVPESLISQIGDHDPFSPVETSCACAHAGPLYGGVGGVAVRIRDRLRLDMWDGV